MEAQVPGDTTGKQPKALFWMLSKQSIMSRVNWPPLSGINPVWTTVIITVLAYAIVLATFFDALPIYPDLSRGTIDTLSHATAIINAITIFAIVLAVYWIRAGRIRRHARAMSFATVTILAFLVLYLTRIGGGGQKELASDPHVVLEVAYIVMLAIHILLSMLAVPLVVFALVLALSIPLSQLPDTRHPQIGRIAAVTWFVSLVLGIGAYLILNHIVGAQLVA